MGSGTVAIITPSCDSERAAVAGDDAVSPRLSASRRAPIVPYHSTGAGAADSGLPPCAGAAWGGAAGEGAPVRNALPLTAPAIRPKARRVAPRPPAVERVSDMTGSAVERGRCRRTALRKGAAEAVPAEIIVL